MQGAEVEQQQAQPQRLHPQWGGFGDAVTAADFAAQAAQLYSNEELWQQCQQTGELLAVSCICTTPLEPSVAALQSFQVEQTSNDTLPYVDAGLHLQQELFGWQHLDGILVHISACCSSLVACRTCLVYHVAVSERAGASFSLRLLYHMMQLALQNCKEQLLAQRQTDYVGSMLWAQGNRATEFFSRWVELKETQKAAGVSAAQSAASSAAAVEADETLT